MAIVITPQSSRNYAFLSLTSRIAATENDASRPQVELTNGEAIGVLGLLGYDIGARGAVDDAQLLRVKGRDNAESFQRRLAAAHYAEAGNELVASILRRLDPIAQWAVTNNRPVEWA